jgi:hypothetical protein
MDAGEGLAMVPARLDPGDRIELWMGTLNPRNDAEFEKSRPLNGRPHDNVMYAAWLRRYGARQCAGLTPVSASNTL